MTMLAHDDPSIAAERERCARITESQIVGAEGDDRIERVVTAIRVGQKLKTTVNAERKRCSNVVRSQLKGDDADERIQGIIDAIDDGAEAE
ncbi:hypothetical protein [Sandarakinorhabdus sp. DWP1-3-1]|uniref:hypothetical protein n=1 Tax=Sandarakinorhabdus sp. DWP1-3-1 TaxID=2804627 RepID=UPI003CFB5186